MHQWRGQNVTPIDRARPSAEPERYAQLRADMQRAVRQVCPPWLADRSDDLVQMAVMRIMDIRSKSSAERELKPAYLRRVAYSAMVDEMRRLRRRREVSLEAEGEDDTAPVRTLASETPPPDQVQAGREIGAGIRACLAAMAQSRRLAVTLYLQEHTVPEAARLLGWPFKRTENLVYRGLSNLRDCLAAKGLQP